MRISEEGLLDDENLIGEEQWNTAGAMIKDIRQLDNDTKRDVGGIASTIALKAREHHIKKTHGMEDPE